VFDLKIIEGRALADTDAVGHPLVASSTPRRGQILAGQSPLGKRVQLEKAGPGWLGRISASWRTRSASATSRRSSTGFYLTIAQYVPPGVGLGFIVRSRVPRRRAHVAARGVGCGPEHAILAHLTIAGQYRLSAWQSRFVTDLVVAFALVAVGLCLAGIYAVNLSSSRAGSTNSASASRSGPRRWTSSASSCATACASTLAGLAAGGCWPFAAKPRAGQPALRRSRARRRRVFRRRAAHDRGLCRRDISPRRVAPRGSIRSLRCARSDNSFSFS